MAHNCYRAYVLVHIVCAYCLLESSAARSKGNNHFYAIASRIGTDKVTDHHYESLYEKYLRPNANKSLRLLEVGLGCDMSYGPGHSLKLWTEFLPNSEISFVEYKADCAEEYRETIEREGRGKLYVGDQANVTFLNSVIDDQRGNVFDVIIDDGGHHMGQQRTTITHLWRLVAPGGIYVIEDLLTSYMPVYGGGPKGHPGTMIEMHKDFLDELNCQHQEKCTPILHGLIDMDCFSEACVMVKSH